MLERVLWVIHIATLGTWFGAELVINATSRYVCYSDAMPMRERTRLLQHVLDVDQHVRYALVIQFGLGFALGALFGYLPGGSKTAIGFGVFAVLWLIYVEVVHRLRQRPIGKKLAAFDRGSRYVLLICLLTVAVGLIGREWDLPLWIRWKLALFAGVMACGVAIRLSVLARFRVWAIMERDGPADEHNAIVKQTYIVSTAILVLLWLLIFTMVGLSIYKPL